MKKKQKRVKPIKKEVMIHESSASYAQCHDILQKFIDHLNITVYKGLVKRVVYQTDHCVNAALRYGHTLDNRQKIYPEIPFWTVTMNASDFGGPDRILF